jgi:dihydrofolate synthase/folylpolyglutamate synthase
MALTYITGGKIVLPDSVVCGNPQDSLRFVHVAGTNGKGSFCSMLSSILTDAGYKTGLYTSPYIYRFNERMRVNGEDISPF